MAWIQLHHTELLSRIVIVCRLTVHLVSVLHIFCKRRQFKMPQNLSQLTGVYALPAPAERKSAARAALIGCLVVLAQGGLEHLCRHRAGHLAAGAAVFHHHGDGQGGWASSCT